MKTPRVCVAAACAVLASLVVGQASLAHTPRIVGADVLPANTGLQWHQTAAQVEQTCDDQITAAKATIAKIESLSAPEWTFDDSLLQIETAEAVLNDGTTAQTFLSSVAPAKDVRDAANDCEQKLSDYFNALSADPKIYAIAARVQA